VAFNKSPRYIDVTINLFPETSKVCPKKEVLPYDSRSLSNTKLLQKGKSSDILIYKIIQRER